MVFGCFRDGTSENLLDSSKAVGGVYIQEKQVAIVKFSIDCRAVATIDTILKLGIGRILRSGIGSIHETRAGKS